MEQLKNYIVRSRYIYFKPISIANRNYIDQYIVKKAKELIHKTCFYDFYDYELHKELINEINKNKQVALPDTD